MARSRKYRSPEHALQHDRDADTLSCRRIALSPAQEAMLRRAGELGDLPIADREIRSADILTDWAFIEQIQRRRVNYIRITARGRRWLTLNARRS